MSRMELDTKSRKTMQAFVSPNLFHGALEQAFSGERKRILWRIDILHEKTYLLLVSQDKPDLTSVVKQFGVEGGWEVRDYDPLLQSIQAEERMRFRLTANPTGSKSQAKREDGTKPRGMVFAHTTPEHQRKWLVQRAEQAGFVVNPMEFEIVESRWQHFRKGSENRHVSLMKASYEGILTVTDPAQFIRTLSEGIGRGKAYGMGMLTVMRMR